MPVHYDPDGPAGSNKHTDFCAYAISKGLIETRNRTKDAGDRAICGCWSLVEGFEAHPGGYAVYIVWLPSRPGGSLDRPYVGISKGAPERFYQHVMTAHLPGLSSKRDYRELVLAGAPVPTMEFVRWVTTEAEARRMERAVFNDLDRVPSQFRTWDKPLGGR